MSAPPHRRHGVIGIVLIYAAFASQWILFSDWVLEWLVHDRELFILASTLKGWLFVTVTSLLLYGLLRRLVGRATWPKASGRRGLALPFALIAMLILVLAGAGIAHTVQHQRQTGIARLETIADLKARQIGDWLKERQADAEFVHGCRYYTELYRQWRAGDAASGARLTQGLERLRRLRGFAAVSLLGPGGEPVWASPAAPRQLAPILLAAARAREPRRVGPYLGLADHARLDYVVPLINPAGPAPVVVLHAAPADWLYPTLQSWPVPSTSGETLLFRREGGDALFLNDLRHRQETALRLRVPLARPDLLAAQVLRGEAREGEAVVGHDYRGAEVLGVVRAIPGTDWFLVAKLDRDELDAEARREALWIWLAAMLALFVAGIGLVMLRQRNALDVAAATQRAQAEHIAERNRAAAALRLQAEELARRNDELERFNRASVGRELDMIELKQAVNALSAELGRAPPHDLGFMDAPAPAATAAPTPDPA